MKDFSEWLDELTGELHEPDKDAPVGWACGDDMDWKPVYAQSEPEDTFDGGMWAADLAKKLHQHHGRLQEPDPYASLVTQLYQQQGLSTDVMRGAHTHSLSVRTIPSGPVGHVLYTTGDPDAPDCIKDSRNNDVVLGMCRICGKAEVELSEPCIVLGKNMTATEVNSRQVEAEFRLRRGKSILMEETIKRLDEYRRGTWREEDENE